MPNIKSAVKRVKVTKVKTLRNQMVKSALKTAVKKFETVAVENNKDTATVAYKLAVKKLDQAKAKGILKANTVSRRKSQLTKKFNAIGA